MALSIPTTIGPTYTLPPAGPIPATIANEAGPLSGSNYLYTLPDHLSTHLFKNYLKPEEALAVMFVSKKFRQLVDPNKITGVKKENVISYAAEKGWLSLIEWFHEKLHFPLKQRLLTFAARGGHIAVLKWLQSKSLPIDDKNSVVGMGAGIGGHIHVLEWLREKNCPLQYAIVPAAQAGQLAALQWLITKGYAWDKKMTCINAADSGSLNILAWALADQTPWDKSRICSIAIERGHLHVVKWALENDFPCDAATKERYQFLLQNPMELKKLREKTFPAQPTRPPIKPPPGLHFSRDPKTGRYY